MTSAFRHALENHHWRGNIRELRNVIERAVILADGAELDTDLLPLEFSHPDNEGPAPLSLADMEKKHIARVLQAVNGNKTRAAEMLQIGLTTLYNKIKEYNIR